MSSHRIDRISTLPREVLEIIYREVAETADLSALSRVSRFFRDTVNPILYEDLEIDCDEGFNPRVDVLRPFATDWSARKFNPSLKHVRELAFTTKFVKLIGPGKRCWHHGWYNRRWKRGLDQSDLPVKHVYRPACTTPHRSRNHLDDTGGDEDEECECCEEEEFEDDEDEDAHFHEEHLEDFCMSLSENQLRTFRCVLEQEAG